MVVKIHYALVINIIMRAFLFLSLVLQMMFGGIMLADNHQSNEIRLIRRAYLDVTGLLPTPEEMDWFVVYNNNGYQLAVEHLTTKYNTHLTAKHMLSSAYVLLKPSEISIVQLKRSVLYLVGLLGNDSITEQEFQQGKQRLIEQALMCTTSNDDAIDYICNLLMSRVSSVQENNMLIRKFRDVEALSTEQRAWMVVVDEIMKLPDVKTK